MKNYMRFLIVVCILVAMALTGSAFATTPTPKDNKGPKAAALKSDMRELWGDHVVWTRNVILCLVDDLPGKEQAVKRLMENQVDIGDAFSPYYGKEMGKNLTSLLQTHVSISEEVVIAARAGNARSLEIANKEWHDNADKLSAFLCASNPRWNLEDMQMMMHEHLQLTTDEVTFRINRDYLGDVTAYDKVNAAILKMSDMFTIGIVRQFPEKFKATK